MSTIPLQIQALIDHLNSQKLDATIQEETGQAVIIFSTEKQGQKLEFPTFFRIYEEGALLQILSFVPTMFTKQTSGDTARLLHAINKELDIPGFGMDEDAHAVYYRIMLPSTDATINTNLFNSLLKAIDQIISSFAPAIMQVSQGNATFDSLLQQAKKLEKETPKKPPRA